MARARARRGRPQAVTTLPPWPLDEPREAPARAPGAAVDHPPPMQRSNGQRPAPATQGPRPGDSFFCRRCHRSEQTGGMPPVGWFRVQQAHHDPGKARYTFGLYCSSACVVADMGASQ